MNRVMAGCALAGMIFVSSMTGACAETVRGQARIVDGDTINVAGRRIKLLDIDAPEQGETCRDGQQRLFDCGESARRELERLIADREVTCRIVGLEQVPPPREPRQFGLCRAGSTDLNLEMVRSGWAVPYHGTERYLEAGVDSAKATRGLHAGVFMDPNLSPEEAWRAAEALSTHPEGCPIKGNINGTVKIYHMPGTRDYRRTKIDKPGEMWFCSKDEATGADWRPVGN